MVVDFQQLHFPRQPRADVGKSVAELQAEIVQCGEVGLNNAAFLRRQGQGVAPELGGEALKIKIRTGRCELSRKDNYVRTSRTC